MDGGIYPFVKIRGTESHSEMLCCPTATESLRTGAERLYKQRVKDGDKHLHVSEDCWTARVMVFPRNIRPWC